MKRTARTAAATLLLAAASLAHADGETIEGQWAGVWEDTGSPATLTVGAKPKSRIVYCYERGCSRNTYLKDIATSDAKVKFSWGGRFEFTLDAGTLKGSYTRGDDIAMQIVMRRVETHADKEDEQ